MVEPETWWPRAVSGVGLVLGAVLAGEFYPVVVGGPPQDGFVVGVLSSAPFLVWLVYGGYWVGASDLATDRYGRIGAWVVGGLGAFLALNLVIMVVLPPADLWMAVGWIRWAAAIGGGVGLLIGIFEARAVDREIAVERTESRRLAIERQNERLEEFAGVVSHDLRNPLNVAFASVEHARKEHDSGDLDRAASALERMDQIVERTLTLARSGRRVGELQRVELAGVARESWRNVDTAEASLTVEDVGTVSCDPDRLRHLFENLYRNAVEHGGPNVTIRVGCLLNGFFVEDDGPGIPPGERPEVLDAGFSTADGGSGLGLAIVRQVVEAHDWEIEVTAAEGGGARFEITGVDAGN